MFLVFLFSAYYPSGGWDDYAGSFESLEKAYDFALERIGHWSNDYAHIVDVDKKHAVISMTFRPYPPPASIEVWKEGEKTIRIPFVAKPTEGPSVIIWKARESNKK